MIEDKSIVFVFHHVHVFFKEELDGVEFAVDESEEIFELDGDGAGRYS